MEATVAGMVLATAGNPPYRTNAKVGFVWGAVLAMVLAWLVIGPLTGHALCTWDAPPNPEMPAARSAVPPLWCPEHTVAAVGIAGITVAAVGVIVVRERRLQ
jgi:hypothetical protein